MKRLIVLSGLILLQHAAGAQNVKRCMYFDNASHQLSPSSIPVLDSMIRAALRAPVYRFNIIGNTDSIGTDRDNLRLSEKRCTGVLRYLVSKGIDAKNIRHYSAGEVHPLVSNAEEHTRRFNRRVDVVLIREFPPAKKAPAIVKAAKPVDYEAWPYVRTGEKGSLVKIKDCTFSPAKPEDVRIEIEEVLDRQAMYVKGTTTIDSKGNCLSSGGMIYIRCFVKGKPVEPNKDCPMEISIPTGSFDPEMELFSSANASDKNAVWNAENTKPTSTASGGRTYYTFNTSRGGGFNMDKVVPAVAPLAAPAKLLSAVINMFSHPNITIKIREAEEYFGRDRLKVMLSVRDQNIIVAGKRTGRNKYRFTCPCLRNNPQNADVVIVADNRKDRVYRADFRASEFSGFRNMSVFEEDDFREDRADLATLSMK